MSTDGSLGGSPDGKWRVEVSGYDNGCGWDEDREIPRVCATCRYFEFHEATQCYSEMTPGTDASFECDKGYWRVETEYCTEADFRSTMLAALLCNQYEAVEVEPLVPQKPKWEVDQEAQTAALAALIARYPHVRIHIDSERRGCEFRAWYDAGYGPTLSKLTRDRGEAIQWLTECLDALSRAGVPNAVQTD